VYVCAGKIVNPIGAGDTVGAVFVAAVLHGWEVPAAFVIALAAGTASCLKVKGSSFTMSDVETIHKGIIMREIQAGSAATASTPRPNSSL